MNNDRLVFALKSSPCYVDGRRFVAAELRGIGGRTIALNLEQSHVGDAEIQTLPPLPNLRCLDLDGTRITDKALSLLTQFPRLEELWLEGTSISDEGLKKLHGTKGLRFVSVAYTAASRAGVAELKTALPGLEVSA